MDTFMVLDAKELANSLLNENTFAIKIDNKDKILEIASHVLDANKKVILSASPSGVFSIQIES